jgi:hypothetical protein
LRSASPRFSGARMKAGIWSTAMPTGSWAEITLFTKLWQSPA